MERLTSNKSVSEMGMVELAYNSCFVKDRSAWYRDYGVEVDARILARKLLKDFADGDDAFTCDEDFEEYITACLEDGTDSIEGLIALFYRNLWAMAGLRERLKYYEDLEEQGKLLKLPCAVGDTVYTNHSMKGWYFREKGRPYAAEVVFIGINSTGGFINVEIGAGHMTQFQISDLGKRFFLTRKEAEAALKEVGE